MAEKWIGKSKAEMQRKGTVGSLHRALGVPQGKKIPMFAVEKAAHSENPKLRKKAQWAINVRKGG